MRRTSDKRPPRHNFRGPSSISSLCVNCDEQLVRIVMRLTPAPSRICDNARDKLPHDWRPVRQCSTTTSWARLNLPTGCDRARHAIGCASRSSSDAHAPFQPPLLNTADFVDLNLRSSGRGTGCLRRARQICGKVDAYRKARASARPTGLIPHPQWPHRGDPSRSEEPRALIISQHVA